MCEVPRPVAGTNKSDGAGDWVRNTNRGLWASLQRRMRGSVSVVVRVEHTLGLLVSYTCVGGLIAYWVSH